MAKVDMIFKILYEINEFIKNDKNLEKPDLIMINSYQLKSIKEDVGNETNIILGEVLKINGIRIESAAFIHKNEVFLCKKK